MTRLPEIPMKFMTSKQLEKCCVKLYGLEYHEALEGAYDNLRAYTIALEKRFARLDKALMVGSLKRSTCIFRRAKMH